MSFWAYMLHCRGGYLYTGHTDDFQRRVDEHRSGAVPGFASDHLPVELVWSQEFPSRYEALAAERQIKGWSRAKKLALIRGDWSLISTLAKGKGSPSTSSGRTEQGMAFDLMAFDHCETLQISAQVERIGEQLTFTYQLSGDLEDIVIPVPATPQRTDGLWQATCFEAFISVGKSSYVELNFSPSGEWAAYRFSNYRQGMCEFEIAPPQISFANDRLTATVELPTAGGASLSLAAVLQHASGSRSYWALAHCGEQPDFHDPDCFVARLP